MVSTKFKGYHKKLFLPAAVSLWILIAIIGIFHFTRSENVRHNIIRSNIDVIVSRIVNLYETRSDDRVPMYISFVENYFKKTEYYDLCISIYDTSSGDLICSMGYPMEPPLGIPNTSLNKKETILDGVAMITPANAFYYREQYTSNHNVVVQAMLPTAGSVLEAITDSMWFFMFLFLLGVLMTFFAFWFTNILAQNIQNLNQFVECAVKDEDFDENMAFPDDELGEISSKIVKMYKARSTAIEQMEKEHARAMAAIEERAKQKKQLTNNLNHELKTPLGIIKGYIETLLASPEINKETRTHFLNKSYSQVLRLQDILNNISTITRLEETQNSVTIEKIDFYALAFDVADEVVEAGTNGGMKIVIDLPDECMVKGNENLLSAMLLNLTKNAVIHSGGTEIGLTLLEKTNKECKFAFYDNGVGVDEAHLPYLFDRFYRVDAGRSRKVGGTGLGLSIVKWTILALGGQISARNRQTGGLEIDFSLPIWEDDNDNKEQK